VLRIGIKRAVKQRVNERDMINMSCFAEARNLGALPQDFNAIIAFRRETRPLGGESDKYDGSCNRGRFDSCWFLSMAIDRCPRNPAKLTKSHQAVWSTPASAGLRSTP
jgi:hypothetical protein